MPEHTFGSQLMNQLNEGSIARAPTAFVEEVKSKVTAACEEILDVGARIRPLYVGPKQVGWVRGVHLSERRVLQRWIYDDLDMVEQILLLGTSFGKEQIAELSSPELRSISRVVAEMTESDSKLYPYLRAFCTTTASEQLWFGLGTTLTAYRNRVVELPDGGSMRLLTSPEHARMWAALCNYREHAKRRLDANLNALMTVRPHVGKGADAFSNDLKAVARGSANQTVHLSR